jgi:hypothetical protein
MEMLAEPAKDPLTALFTMADFAVLTTPLAPFQFTVAVSGALVVDSLGHVRGL